MFYHIKGVVSELLPSMAVIDCGGVGFGLNASLNTLSQLTAGESAMLYISEQVKEDAFELYGFKTLAEKRCFEMLISVSGVGPKAAMSILSSNTTEGVCLALMSGDDKALTAAQGVGKKLAQRIVLELKDKMQKQASELDFSGAAITAAGDGGAQKKLSDALSALGVLGYSSAECSAAMKGVDVSLPLEDIIRAALRNMMK